MSEMKQPQNVTRHEFCVTDRHGMHISGVKEILCFDELNVRLLTVLGELVIDGDGLRVKVLDVEKGTVALEGRIDGVMYAEDRPAERKGFFARLFG